MLIFTPAVERQIAAALEEDLGPGDITTQLCIPAQATAQGEIVAREDLMLCGAPVAERVLRIVDGTVEVTWHHPEGARVEAGASVGRVEGPAASVLAAERVMLNFLQRLSGIATLTARYVDAVRGTGARICDTRKTTPGLRALEKYAVRTGGGHNHRFGLYDGVLIKDNHIAAVGGVGAAVRTARASAPHLLRIEVEVRDLYELDEAIAARADAVLLDNFPPREWARAVRRTRGGGAPPVLVEISGGVDLERARLAARAGADLISVGALTHSAPAADMALELESRREPKASGGRRSRRQSGSGR